MNIFNKLGLTLVIIATTNPLFAQDTNPIKWSVSLGSGQTTFERTTLVTTDAGQSLKTEEVDFSPTMFTLGARSGKHSFSVATNVADEDNLSLGGSYYTELENPSVSSDYSDTSLTYTYSPGGSWSKWRVSLGYTSVSMDETTSELYTYDDFVPNDGDAWQWADSTTSSTDRSGTTALVSYVQPLGESGKVFAVARLGIISQDYENKISGESRVSGVSQATEDIYLGNTAINVSNPNFINGDGWDISGTTEGDSTTGIFGFSVIYVLDNPRHSLNFDFSVRENEYGELSGQPGYTLKNGLLTSGYNDTAATNEPITGQDIDETISAFSIKWRYSLN